jgi:membrane fusion protein (multidrug efflux system)
VASSFHHTLRSLERTPRWGLWLIPGLMLLCTWVAWMVRAQVSVYASAPRARIEVNHAPSRIASESGGRIVYHGLELGRHVQSGDLLLELDASIQRAELAQRVAELSTLETKRGGVEAQLRAERAKRQSRLRLGEVISEGASLDLEQARVVASHQQELTHIAEELLREQLSSKVDALDADGKLLVSRNRVAEATSEIARVLAEHDYQDKADLARIAELGRQLIDLEAERIATEGIIDIAEAELARLRIYAPMDGTVGNVAPLQVGNVVQPGQVIATVVPPDDVRVVAHYPPGPSVGRVLPGQRARLRLDGFSWMEFGMVYATVTQIASESEDGLIRVELILSEADEPRIVLQHGLTGALDIRIEETSPWTLLQRSIGTSLTRLGDRGHAEAAPRIAREWKP